MDTPICDFVRHYAQRAPLRLHMPGHKGAAFLGMEQLDITEVPGADSLYEADGIIRRSEENASALFGCPTYYSAEGSSLCIRAMLYLALLHAKKHGRSPVIAAGRNAHKTFLSAAALLDLNVQWLYPEGADSYLSCHLTAPELEKALLSAPELPAAVYLTTPDYLGDLVDLREISALCRKLGILLLVDNAHGAYLRFLPESRFPIDLGADLCCSSAHKTLPVLTGGAYLHISPALSAALGGQAKQAMALFGSTSPSYLILQSLDAANAFLADYPRNLADFCQQIQLLKARLADHGFLLYGSEPLKLTLQTKPWGYRGAELAHWLLARDIVCEFADPDHLVLMLTPEIGVQGLARLENALLQIPRKSPILQEPPEFHPPEVVCSIREAALSPSEHLPVDQCCGRTLAAATVGCPPAVPILVCGERIDPHAIACFRYYGITHCAVLPEALDGVKA